jgi:ABC-2 type transport system permease protein
MRLAWQFLRVGVMNEFQYRANFVIQLLQSGVAIVTGLVVLALIFGTTDDLSGWTQPQLLIVMGVFTIMGGIIGFVIEPNMGRLMADIQQGTFDYVLTKPVDSQLLTSVREFRLWRLTDVVVGAVVMSWGVGRLEQRVGWEAVVAFVLLLFLGGIMIYCFWLLLTTGAFWFVRMEMMQELFTGLYRAGQYPVGIYPGWLRVMLTFLVPIAFAVTVPSGCSGGTPSGTTPGPRPETRPTGVCLPSGGPASGRPASVCPLADRHPADRHLFALWRTGIRPTGVCLPEAVRALNRCRVSARGWPRAKSAGI